MKYTDYYLKQLPFVSVFQETMIKDIDNIFVGREQDTENIFDLAFSGASMFVHGIFGVGKTIVIRKVLNDLEDESVFTIYVNGFQLLYKNILEQMLKKIMAEGFENIDNNEIDQILQMIKGHAVLNKTTQKSGINKVIKYTTDNEEAIKMTIDITNIESYISEYLSYIIESDRKVCIAIDGLDLDISSDEIPSLTNKFRKLFIEKGVSVIIVGHPLGVMSGFGSYSDILEFCTISVMNKEEMKLMIKKYLNWQRTDNFDHSIGIFFPFDEEVIDYITDTIYQNRLSARLLHKSLAYIFNIHKKNNLSKITLNSTKKYWDDFVNEHFKGLKKEDLYAYSLIKKIGKGKIEEDNYKLIEEIGGEFALYSEVIDKVNPLLINDILLATDQSSMSYQLNPMLEEMLIK